MVTIGEFYRRKKMNEEDKIVHSAEQKMDKIIGNLEPENVRWCWSQDVDVSEQEDRCYSCAKIKADKLTIELKEKVIVDGGSSVREMDTCAHCQDCEKLLAYSLTECGAESELDHFLEKDFKIDVSGKSGKEVAYHIREVLYCYNAYDKHKERIVELAKKVLNLPKSHKEGK